MQKNEYEIQDAINRFFEKHGIASLRLRERRYFEGEYYTDFSNETIGTSYFELLAKGDFNPNKTLKSLKK